MARGAISLRLNSIKGTVSCIFCGKFTALDKISRGPPWTQAGFVCSPLPPHVPTVISR